MDYCNLRSQTWYITAWIYNTPDIQGAAVVMVVVAATVVGSARKMVDGLSQDNKTKSCSVSVTHQSES